MSEKSSQELFEFFNEIGIISQLSSALFNRALPGAVHVAHFALLNHMVRLGDGCTPVKLASAFQVTKATMTHSLTVLEKSKFIELKPNPADGRSKLVYLTPEGRDFRNTAIKSVLPTFRAVLGKLDANHVKDILPHLRKIREVLDAARN